jgi:Asp-tRNA(Asn)/Glu-tRNA(Gln) amidotransferase A subunit family amidase
MAASIDDLALAYRVMASPAPAEDDALSSGFPDPLTTIPSQSAESSRPKTIGLVRPWIDRAEPTVRAFFDAAVDFYRNQKGYSVVDIEIPYLPEGQRAQALTILSEIASGIDPADVSRLLPHSKLLITVSGSNATSQDYIAAQKLRQLLMSHLGHLFTRYPGLIIMTPTTPIPGWKIAGGEKDLTHGVSDGKASTRNMEYVWLANFVGCPAISCPVGYFRGSNMPVGIMGMSEWGSEEALIAFARDGEGILDLDIAASPTSNGSSTTAAEEDAVVVAKGLRTPHDASRWVDLIVEAKKKDLK